MSKVTGDDTYNNAVVPSKNGKFVETCYEIPTRGDVSSDEDEEGEDRERVHELSSFMGHERKDGDDPGVTVWRGGDCLDEEGSREKYLTIPRTLLGQGITDT